MEGRGEVGKVDKKGRKESKEGQKEK